MSKTLGGISAVLVLIIASCSGAASASDRTPEQTKVQASSVDDGYNPRIYVEDPWQLGYCLSAENDAAEAREGEGEYGTGSYGDLLSNRPCTLDLAFNYGELLEKYRLVGEKNHDKIWGILSSKDSKFRDNVIQFSDGYAENFVNR